MLQLPSTVRYFEPTRVGPWALGLHFNPIVWVKTVINTVRSQKLPQPEDLAGRIFEIFVFKSQFGEQVVPSSLRSAPTLVFRGCAALNRENKFLSSSFEKLFDRLRRDLKFSPLPWFD